MKPDQPANIVDDQGGEPVGSREVIRIHKHKFHIISGDDGADIVSTILYWLKMETLTD